MPKVIENPPSPLEIERNTLAKERTRLALERTFLSWIRTGLTSIGIGIVIARFIIFHDPTHRFLGHLVGQLLILWGISIFAFALFSYRRSALQIQPLMSFWKTFRGLTFATFFLIVLSFVLFWIVIE